VRWRLVAGQAKVVEQGKRKWVTKEKEAAGWGRATRARELWAVILEVKVEVSVATEAPVEAASMVVGLEGESCEGFPRSLDLYNQRQDCSPRLQESQLSIAIEEMCP